MIFIFRPKELKLKESTSTLINPALSPSSSGVPLIRDNATDNEKGTYAVQLQENSDFAENKSVSKLFSFLQVLTAMFGSFAHGGNDVR